MLANFSDESVTIPKATVLGIAEGISESLVDKINAILKLTSLNQPNPLERERMKPCTTNLSKGNWTT